MKMGKPILQLFVWCIFFFACNAAEDPADLCASLWRPDTLSGKCFGLKKISEYRDGGVDVPDPADVNTVDACRSLCCKLGDKCVR